MSTPQATESPDQAISRQERTERWIEILLAAIMGVVALATAWSGYQSARWGGVQSIAFTRAGALRAESMRVETEAGLETQVDVDLFLGYVEAYAQDDEPLMDYYYDLFRDEFRVAFDVWMATDPANNPEAPVHPFYMDEYQVAKRLEADELEAQAVAFFDEGRAANQQSDDYVLNAVILASVLFLSGIAARFDWLPVRVAIIVVAFIMLSWGLYHVATYPIY
jgi:hypothetical protein